MDNSGTMYGLNFVRNFSHHPLISYLNWKLIQILLLCEIHSKNHVIYQKMRPYICNKVHLTIFFFFTLCMQNNYAQSVYLIFLL